MALLANTGAQLVIFDYSDKNGRFAALAGERFGYWTPLHLPSVSETLKRCGWRVYQIDDLSDLYLKWYQDLCSRFQFSEAAIVRQFGQSWYDFAISLYRELTKLIDDQIIGGAIVRAELSK